MSNTLTREQLVESLKALSIIGVGTGSRGIMDDILHHDAVRADLLRQQKNEIERLHGELAVAKCGEALCGHDHSVQYWELRANKAESMATDAQEAIGHWQAEAHKLQQQLTASQKATSTEGV